ncbi:MAG: ABC transporter ATP-binding protein, partial [Myxococcales bacterium]|nr:ABC transporter ATP-binding protein [Myxococcales bacterium]
TTLKAVTGQLVPDSGAVLLNGTDLLADSLASKRVLGYVPQELHLFPYLTGYEFLRFVADIKGVEGDGDAEIRQLMESLYIWEAKDRLTREYSEGMARKLAICAALVGSPPLLILDESLNGLDPQSARVVKDRLELAKREQGASIILVSHILDMVERVCDRVALQHEGRVARIFTRAELAENRQRGSSLEELYLDVVGLASDS